MVKKINKEIHILDDVLSKEEMTKQMEENNIIEGIISIHISDIIHNDLEKFLDIISEKLTGNPCLMNINYNVVVGDEPDDAIYLKVTGDASMILDME